MKLSLPSVESSSFLNWKTEPDSAAFSQCFTERSAQVRCLPICQGAMLVRIQVTSTWYPENLFCLLTLDLNPQLLGLLQRKGNNGKKKSKICVFFPIFFLLSIKIITRQTPSAKAARALALLRRWSMQISTFHYVLSDNKVWRSGEPSGYSSLLKSISIIEESVPMNTALRLPRPSKTLIWH